MNDAQCIEEKAQELIKTLRAAYMVPDDIELTVRVSKLKKNLGLFDYKSNEIILSNELSPKMTSRVTMHEFAHFLQKYRNGPLIKYSESHAHRFEAADNPFDIIVPNPWPKQKPLSSFCELSDTEDEG